MLQWMKVQMTVWAKVTGATVQWHNVLIDRADPLPPKSQTATPGHAASAWCCSAVELLQRRQRYSAGRHSYSATAPAGILQRYSADRHSYSATAPAGSYIATAPAGSYSATAPAGILQRYSAGRVSYSATAPAGSYSATAPAGSYSATAPAGILQRWLECLQRYSATH